MQRMRTDDREEFPLYGARARLWGRFERDLREWLETPEGRFAAWPTFKILLAARRSAIAKPVRLLLPRQGSMTAPNRNEPKIAFLFGEDPIGPTVSSFGYFSVAGSLAGSSSFVHLPLLLLRQPFPRPPDHHGSIPTRLRASKLPFQCL